MNKSDAKSPFIPHGYMTGHLYKVSRVETKERTEE